MLLELLLIFILLCMVCMLGYLYWLMMVYFIKDDNVSTPDAEYMTRFVIIIPAHDEAEIIDLTLQNIKNIEYPSHLMDVLVVADNCTDSTADITRGYGVTCFERTNIEKRGKGYALQYAFDHLNLNEYDAFVVIDADSVVDSNFLQVMNNRLVRGQQVIQAYYGLTNPDTSPLTYLFHLGNIMEYKFFYEAKEHLGLSILLGGNGMCFSRAIIKAHPWNAFSIVEDTEYGLKLLQAGIRVHFASETRVLAKQPETLQQAYTQRVRWASGNASLSKSYAAKLMLLGVSRGGFTVFDAGFTFFVLSRPLMLFTSLALLVVCWLLNALGLLGFQYTAIALATLVAQLLYVAMAIVMTRPKLKHLMYLLRMPLLAVWFIYVSLLGLVGFRKNLWLRTERS